MHHGLRAHTFFRLILYKSIFWSDTWTENSLLVLSNSSSKAFLVSSFLSTLAMIAGCFPMTWTKKGMSLVSKTISLPMMRSWLSSAWTLSSQSKHWIWYLSWSISLAFIFNSRLSKTDWWWSEKMSFFRDWNLSKEIPRKPIPEPNSKIVLLLSQSFSYRELGIYVREASGASGANGVTQTLKKSNVLNILECFRMFRDVLGPIDL